jgi:hypothetical protein
MQQSITLPYLRTSPVHVPRRDIVLSVADSLLLSVAVVERDDPSSQALILTTDADGPSMQLVLWDDTQWCGSDGWDYGWSFASRAPRDMLQSITGVPGSAAGSWDFEIPTGTFSNFPLRCGWAVLLLWNNGAKSSVLGQGIAHFLRPFFKGVPLSAIPPVTPPIIPPPVQGSHVRLTTDDLHPIITSDTSGANTGLHLETS